MIKDKPGENRFVFIFLHVTAEELTSVGLQPIFNRSSAHVQPIFNPSSAHLPSIFKKTKSRNEPRKRKNFLRKQSQEIKQESEKLEGLLF